jgi:hypothetical protein
MYFGRLLFVVAVIASGCSARIQKIHSSFEAHTPPQAPDYSRLTSWASLPSVRDAADSIPRHSGLVDGQASAVADVFFVYPTIYTGKPNEQSPWNADVGDMALRRGIQSSTILNQASIFNGSCRVYAPYYRQAHLYAFYTGNAEDGRQALDLAYQDVKAAFEYYLRYYNEGRPIVIASHSQGSYHALRLMQEYVDGKPLQSRLVAAYLVGRAIPRDAFMHIPYSESPEMPGVWASWNTFARGFTPETWDRNYKEALSVNPLLWNTSADFAPQEKNTGGVGPKFTMLPHLADAQNHNNMLWINRPYVKGRFLLRTKVWHRADMNLYYNNIRENVALRIASYVSRGEVSNTRN